MRKKLLSLALALVMCLGLPIPAMAAESDFVIQNGLLTKYNGSGGDVVIPAGVTSIASTAFYHCTGPTSVTIPDSVTRISGNPFDYCENLTSIYVSPGKQNYKTIPTWTASCSVRTRPG